MTSHRMTYSTAMVLLALAAGHRYGFDIINAVGVRSGTVYPLLRRLERSRIVRARWEPVAVARSSRRPPRKYYELTPIAQPLLALARERFPGIRLEAGRPHAEAERA